jgi:signal transduction histidine kinase
MREHAAEAGGALDLRSGPSGTTILIRVPASAVASTTALETTA